MTFYTTTFTTPFGEFSAAVDENSSLIATAFGNIDALSQRVRIRTVAQLRPSNSALPATLVPTPGSKPSRVAPPSLRRTGGELTFITDPARTRRVRTQVLEYCRGARRDFDLPLNPTGTIFQQRVWSQLAQIPRGQTRSYAEVARALASSPRAVGRANATNPICLIVPFHRVIGADGSLTGYAFGEPLKQQLLEFESS